MLKHTYKKIKCHEEIRIAYFGGSITQGAGSSNWSKNCWRAIVTQWFSDNYPNSKFVEINASIGGSGSDYGAFRIDTDVLSFNPDLVFIEFCTNDTVVDDCFIYEETLIRKIIENNPETDIILIRTMTEKMCYKLLNIKPHESYLAYEKLSKYYDIPLIDVGAEFRKKIGNNIKNIYKYTIDGVHPNDLGYLIYSKKIISYLKNNLSMKEILTDNSYMNAVIIKAKDINDTNMKLADNSYYNDYGSLVGDSKKNYLKFVFFGKEIGIFARVAKNTGIIKWKIDDEDYNTLNLFDEYALKFDRNAFFVLSKNLEYKKHVLYIKVSGESDKASQGNLFILNGIFYV